MKGPKSIFALCGISFLSACSSTHSSRAEKNSIEMALHKVRTDVEEIKHDLNTYEIEHHILEGKFIDQENVIHALKESAFDTQQNQIEQFAKDLSSLDKKHSQLVKQQDKMIADLRQLSSNANDTRTALSQYKEKISALEKTLQTQGDQISEMITLNKTLSQFLKSDLSSDVYTVKTGDSLKKIAEAYSTTVEKLKEANHLEDDNLIIVGQKITIPKKS